MTMTRSSFRPIASIGLVAAVLAYVGCSRTHETPEKVATKVDTKAPEVDDKGEKVPKFMADWLAHPPAGILLISGEQLGYPDPCGCTSGQLGGLGRRYDLLDKLQAKGWPVAKIDLGNLIRYRADSRGGAKQEKIKFDVIFDALAMMKYDAIALGPEDLRLDAGELIGMLLNSQPPKYPVFLAANVKLVEKELASTLASIKISQAGPVTLGITSVIADEDIQANGAGLFEVKPPDEVIPGLLDELNQKKVQVKILMVEGPHEEAKRLAEKFPGFDIVVGTSKFDDPDEHPETVNDGKTLLVNNIGKKGKYVGVVGFFPGSTPMIQFHRQALDDIHYHQAEPMRVLIDEDYQERLKREKVVENFTRFGNSAYPAGAQYLGAEACKDCHPKTYAKWMTTKHATAYEPLTNPKRNRIYDAECISCHTTGFGYKSGWVSAEQTGFLKGNQCENCHGPASLHAAEPDNLAFRKPMAMTAAGAESSNFCTKCHDSDNDHNFSFASRYAQIFHKGLDEYTDPKVHQGRPAKVDVGAAK
jgi:Cytochrome c554 and c-prime